jgi:hypothetical protein
VGGFSESVEATALLFGTAEHRAAFTAFRETYMNVIERRANSQRPSTHRRSSS